MEKIGGGSRRKCPPMDSVVGAIMTMTSAAGIAVPLSVVTRPVIVWTRPMLDTRDP